MEGLTEGRIVHYVLPNRQHRPAIIVKVWRLHNPANNLEYILPNDGYSNLQVFMDSDSEAIQNDAMPPISWRTGVTYSENFEPGTWHWIEKA